MTPLTPRRTTMLPNELLRKIFAHVLLSATGRVIDLTFFQFLIKIGMLSKLLRVSHHFGALATSVFYEINAFHFFTVKYTQGGELTAFGVPKAPLLPPSWALTSLRRVQLKLDLVDSWLGAPVSSEVPSNRAPKRMVHVFGSVAELLALCPGARVLRLFTEKVTALKALDLHIMENFRGKDVAAALDIYRAAGLEVGAEEVKLQITNVGYHPEENFSKEWYPELAKVLGFTTIRRRIPPPYNRHASETSQPSRTMAPSASSPPPPVITASLHPFDHPTDNVSTPRFSPERQTLTDSPLRHPSLTRAGVEAARKLIEPHIHDTPVLTNTTLTQIASKPQDAEALKGTQWEGQKPAEPKVKLFFKAENFQRIGAFKVRGAFHAVKRLIEEEGIEEVRRKGVVTHSSGNHAQALALAARTFSIPAHIVMPTISTPSKIAGTQAQQATIHFSGSTSQEREAVVREIVQGTGATLIPPYDHPHIILGQGTMALEMQEQIAKLLRFEDDEDGEEADVGNSESVDGKEKKEKKKILDAIIAPCGGGGMLSGIATALHGTGIRVFGAEPSFQGADDARRGVAAGSRIDAVKTLTIADGLRTPLGQHTWSVISDPAFVHGLYAVTEQNIKDAMRLVLERMKCFVEPSAVVGLATVLYNEEFRSMVQREAGDGGWNVGVVLSGGNTTVEAIENIFGQVTDKKRKGEEKGDGERDR
ncbi:tryptophan synthase beta subunit-like PLP-dependent enzyme [Stemphylium lycopersici]|uniref:Tryptophan synthase beta subunit-like PLP-dependent enzyme n=1 Tax=Stemphylium lycopersici TaxID=183478 RepID=A0A364NFF8_STELY|nr:tryptophan synthase beta subunit-like PLP-dependent enzyme [Stemphylium lycopersici]